ncbi:hypothetical protein [Deinococcus peraridilitoris]|uniref:hypothetical protein n=1 Tax=Deinococcus peraridilitoris TaxID=432329 RepID=UPI0012F7FFCA|nr:hypothetical protein [Deinococcus peraridilitoris]
MKSVVALILLFCLVSCDGGINIKADELKGTYKNGFGATLSLENDQDFYIVGNEQDIQGYWELRPDGFLRIYICPNQEILENFENECKEDIKANINLNITRTGGGVVISGSEYKSDDFEKVE